MKGLVFNFMVSILFALSALALYLYAHFTGYDILEAGKENKLLVFFGAYIGAFACSFVDELFRIL